MVALLVAPLMSIAGPPLGGPLVDGSVVRARGCGVHFFIAYRDEYALAQWLGGEMVKEGDVLQTTDEHEDFNLELRLTLSNVTTGRTIDVVIEKTLINRRGYSQLVGVVCH